MPLGAAFIQETTVFREFGPVAGNTMRLAYDVAPKIGSLLSRQTLDGDVRHYLRLGGSGLLATRLRGFKSMGDFPDFQYFGGNSELRGYDYLQFAGQNVVFANAELRFPLIEAALTPIGVIGGIRGVFFAGIGGAWFNNQPSANPCTGQSSTFRFSNSSTANCQVPTGYKTNAAGQVITNIDPVTGVETPILNFAQSTVSGFRLQDGRASYGLGLETFALGFPIHFDWSWRTLFNRGWEDVVFACASVNQQTGACINGAADWRKPRFAMWIGYDF
jgi:outer membrane protein assembly factor BamA